MANAVPKSMCVKCREYLPHWCAPIITITRAKWTGKRIVTIQDRK